MILSMLKAWKQLWVWSLAKSGPAKTGPAVPLATPMCVCMNVCIYECKGFILYFDWIFYNAFPSIMPCLLIELRICN